MINFYNGFTTCNETIGTIDDVIRMNFLAMFFTSLLLQSAVDLSILV